MTSKRTHGSANQLKKRFAQFLQIVHLAFHKDLTSSPDLYILLKLDAKGQTTNSSGFGTILNFQRLTSGKNIK